MLGARKFVNMLAKHNGKTLMLNLNLAQEPDDTLIVRVAWLYYVGGLNQDRDAKRRVQIVILGEVSEPSK